MLNTLARRSEVRRDVLEEEQGLLEVGVNLDCLLERLESSGAPTAHCKSSSRVDDVPLDCSSQLGRLGGCLAAAGSHRWDDGLLLVDDMARHPGSGRGRSRFSGT